MRFATNIVVALLVAGCVRAVALERPFSVGVGETVRVGPVSVLLTEILEDSRCPADVQCLWAGRVRFALAASVRGERFDGEIGLPGETFAAEGYTVDLLGVEPDRAVQGIPSVRYSARLVVRSVD